ncbi:DUF222 domain-containing protein [Actinopolymorpha sp. B17G11]|uniref:HNH endonuclease signature motif containing protein n=1 Tax=Actinopolymorpha sp. B17G11 TaxID=3160861 RepID=UPI0032E4890A
METGTTRTTPQQANALSVVVSRMRSRLGEELPPALWSMGEGELIDLLVDLQGLIAQCDAGLLAAISEADRRDLGKTAGATSTTSWLSDILRIRLGQASRKVKLARDLDTSLVMTRTEMNTGRISADTADVIAQTMRDLPSEAGPDARFDAEHAMLEHARTFHPGELTKIGTTILNSGESPSHAGEKPHLVIRIDSNDLANGTGYATLLRTGTPISARTAQRMACDAKISVRGTINGEEALTDGTRLFVGKTRRLLELRDRGCAFPGCDRPPSWCEGHHVIAWLKGGPNHGRERRLAVRISPPPHPPGSLDRAHSRRRHAGICPTRMDQQNPRTLTQHKTSNVGVGSCPLHRQDGAHVGKPRSPQRPLHAVVRSGRGNPSHR